MAKLTKADAARQLGISRTTLYKLIDQGKVSATPDGLIDQAELVRVAPYVDTLKERSRTAMDTPHVDTNIRDDEHLGRPLEDPREQRWTDVNERQWTSTDDLVHILREQLQSAQERERRYEERERDYREHIARLTAMLHEAHQRSDRLLDMPRSTSTPAPPLLITTSNIPATRGETARGDMRRRIVALLYDHPEGLTPAEIRTRLQIAKRLSNTCIAMLRDGLLRRIGPGRYVAKEE